MSKITLEDLEDLYKKVSDAKIKSIEANENLHDYSGGLRILKPHEAKKFAIEAVLQRKYKSLKQDYNELFNDYVDQETD